MHLSALRGKNVNNDRNSWTGHIQSSPINWRDVCLPVRQAAAQTAAATSRAKMHTF